MIGIEFDYYDSDLLHVLIYWVLLNSSKITQHEFSAMVEFQRLGQVWMMVFFRPKTTGHTEALDWCSRQSGAEMQNGWMIGG